MLGPFITPTVPHKVYLCMLTYNNIHGTIKASKRQPRQELDRLEIIQVGD
jgi:hypothetical protein